MKRTGNGPSCWASTFDAVTMETAVARCLELCRAPRASHTVITANASHLCMMRRDPELARACRAGHLIVADGMSVVWALRASGQPVPERVAGVDLMARLLAAAGRASAARLFPRRQARGGHDAGASGAGPSTPASRSPASATAISARTITCASSRRSGPAGRTCCSSACPPPSRRPGASATASASRCPSSWAWAAASTCSPASSSGPLAGCSRWGMEWFWRLLMEPRKLWKRYLTTNSEFIWLAGREIVARRLGRPPATQSQK